MSAANDDKFIIEQREPEQMPATGPDRMRLPLTALVHMMTQAVAFGVGALIILTTPLADYAAIAFPIMIAISLVVGFVAAWVIAPRLRARYWDTTAPLADAAPYGLKVRPGR
ncbi:MAG: hypothetical protein JNK46_20660 [Methylobacteriaceae bacterium]|nr:hypothetical protein [Methylobacteriaceae bacterium]